VTPPHTLMGIYMPKSASARYPVSAEMRPRVREMAARGQALPKDVTPKSTTHPYFMLWGWDGTPERIHHALYIETPEREGRHAIPPTHRA
jgi:hypothetical protein